MPISRARRRPPDQRPRFRRGRIILIAVVVVLLFLLLFARAIAGLYTDFLWFDSLGYRSVWTGILGTQLALGIVFGLVFAGLAVANLVIAERVAPPWRPPGPEEEMLAPVHDVVGRFRRLVVAAVVLLPALGFGGSAAARWNEWLLFRNQVRFGVDDPQFGRDVGYYVFQLPFLSFLADWVFVAAVVIFVMVAAAHYLNGGIRFQAPGLVVSAGVKAHLSTILAVIALVKAANYYLDRYELLLSSRGVVRGAGYTDVNAQLPAIQLLIAISLLAAALLVYNIRQRGLRLPAVALGLWALVSVLAGGIYPAAIQRFRVEPAESAREAPYIARNIEATRAAAGLHGVIVREFDYNEDLTAADLLANADTIRNVRLWDPRVLQRTYQRLQEVRTFYRFNDVDVDRYVVDGQYTQIVLSARELNPDSLPADTWENRHLAFTHGYGAVLSPANAVTADGQPDFLVQNIPPQGEPRIDEPRLYHGEGLGAYAIVNTARDEIDYLREDGTAVTTRYDGRGGVGIGSLPRRIAFALRFGDLNPVISTFMTSESRILYVRDVRDRVEMLAPFLHFDHDPYPAVIDGRIVWIIDAYTTSDRYPYAERAENGRLSGNSGLRHDFNYVRNSVKVTVDSYHGDVDFYVVDPDDPIATAYARAFPRLFRSGEEVPDELRAHFRYPEDLFRVQTNMWGRYHISDPDEFYSQSDRWTIAQDPGTAAGITVEIDPEVVTGAAGRMDPYYLLTRLPGQEDPEFLILQPFVPFSEDDTRRELSAFMVAKADPEDYGTLEVFVMPRDRQVDGPAIVNARMNQQPEVSSLITLLSRAGSEVVLGNLVLVPVEQSLIYIRPLYVQATGANAVPELKQVIVGYGANIVIAKRLQEALAAIFGAAPETLEEDPIDTVPIDGVIDVGGAELNEDARRLLSAANDAFAAADAALRAGDPVEYATKMQEGRRAFEQALALLGGLGLPPTTTTLPPVEG